MISKKSPKANLEKKRYAFFQIGLILSGGLCLAAFEYVSAKSVSPYFIADKNIPSTIDEEPPIEKLYTIEEQQPKKQNVIRYDDIDSVIQVDKIIDLVAIDGDKDTTTNIIVMTDPIPGGSSSGKGPAVDSTFSDLDVDVPPAFIGGEAAMANWIVDNIDIPNFLISKGGVVYVGFVVKKDGSIDKVNIVRGIEKPLDNAAIDVVKGMPKWKPGEVKGKPVNVSFILPLNIKLD